MPTAKWTGMVIVVLIGIMLYALYRRCKAKSRQTHANEIHQAYANQGNNNPFLNLWNAMPAMPAMPALPSLTWGRRAQPQPTYTPPTYRQAAQFEEVRDPELHDFRFDKL